MSISTETPKGKQSYPVSLTYGLAVLLHVVSFFLPVTESDEWLGWRVAYLSLHPAAFVFAGPAHIGFIVATWAIPKYAFRRARNAAITALVAMVVCGVLTPEHPHWLLRLARLGHLYGTGRHSCVQLAGEQ